MLLTSNLKNPQLAAQLLSSSHSTFDGDHDGYSSKAAFSTRIDGWWALTPLALRRFAWGATAVVVRLGSGTLTSLGLWEVPGKSLIFEARLHSSRGRILSRWWLLITSGIVDGFAELALIGDLSLDNCALEYERLEDWGRDDGGLEDAGLDDGGFEDDVADDL